MSPAKWLVIAQGSWFRMSISALRSHGQKSLRTILANTLLKNVTARVSLINQSLIQSFSHSFTARMQVTACSSMKLVYIYIYSAWLMRWDSVLQGKKNSEHHSSSLSFKQFCRVHPGWPLQLITSWGCNKGQKKDFQRKPEAVNK